MLNAKIFEERVSAAQRQHEQRLKEIENEERVLSILKTSPFIDSPEIEVYVYFYGWRVVIDVSKSREAEDKILDIADVIEQIAGPLHRELNIDWKLLPEGSGLVSLLSNNFSDWQDIKIRINLDQRDLNVCHIEKKLIRQKTDEELERERCEYQFFIKCDEAA